MKKREMAEETGGGRNGERRDGGRRDENGCKGRQRKEEE